MNKEQFEENNTEKRRIIPELLLPVGGRQQLIAAVENGADAIYLGGSCFNARIKADNFGFEEMEEALRYAHSKDVKVYVTLNTLLFDNELEKAIKYAVFLYKIGVDALIIQDFGFAKLIKENLPDFEIHLSTQAGIYNLDGVRSAKEMGFSRVVMARENTLQELSYISKNIDTELEVFVHGALCICYSGQCHLSREIGGRSGNRGTCAQPCRMKYKENKEQGFFLSPKDMSTVHYLKEISESGVKSLKIEGRMKSAEYVAVVCRIYRKYLDEYSKKGYYTVSQKDERSLAQIFNRGDFTRAYYFGNEHEKLMSKDLPKHQGILIGKAINKVSKTLVDVRLNRGEELKIGDGVEFRNSELAGNVLSYCKENKDGSFRIGDIRGNVSKGDKLYKISEKSQLEEIRAEISRAESGKGGKKSQIDLYLDVKKGDYPLLTVSNGGYRLTLSGTERAAEALSTPLSPAKAEAQLRKLGDSPFVAGSVYCKISEGVSLPISILNRLRRSAVEALVELKQGRRDEPKIEIALPARSDLACSGGGQELYLHSFEEVRKNECLEIVRNLTNRRINNQQSANRLQANRQRANQQPTNRINLILPVDAFLERKREMEEFQKRLEEISGTQIETIPYIFPVSKGRLDDYLQNNKEQIVEISEKKGIYIGNLGALSFFKGTKARLFADYGLNITNSEGVAFAKQMGMEKVFLSHEINEEVTGRVPLMISEHLFEEKKISDIKNRDYSLIYLKNIEKTIVYRNKRPEDILVEIHEKNSVRIYI